MMINKTCIFKNFIFFFIFGCSNLSKTEKIDISWEKILNTNKPVEFCQIDSLKDCILLSYSYPLVIGGGSKIIKVNNNKEKSILYAIEGHVINSIDLRLDKIIFNEVDFDKNTLNSTLVISYDSGKSWCIIKTPLRSIRNNYFIGKKIIIEGNKDGVGGVFIKEDNREWINLNTLKMGYKSFFILGRVKNDIICKAFRSFNYRDGELLLYNTETKQVIYLLGFNATYENYLKPINTNNNLYCIVNGRQVSTYILKSDKLIFKYKMKLPKGVSIVQNIYMKENCIIVTARNEGFKGVNLSWISYDKGNNWLPYLQNEGYELIYCSFGELFMKNKNNNVIKGTLSYPQPTYSTEK